MKTSFGFGSINGKNGSVVKARAEQFATRGLSFSISNLLGESTQLWFSAWPDFLFDIKMKANIDSSRPAGFGTDVRET